MQQMHPAKLLTVIETFMIEGRGLVVAPDFSVPTNGWKDNAQEVTVLTPSGQSFSALARFQTSHYNIRDPKASMDKRWRVTLLFPDKTKLVIPIGSSIWTSNELYAALVNKAEQENGGNTSSLHG